jgi:hypothetical protein
MRDFADLERRFTELLEQSSPPLTHSEQREVRHFVDHGEYGVALETLVDIFVEQAKVPTDTIVSAIVALANRMSMDTQPILDRLTQST